MPSNNILDLNMITLKIAPLILALNALGYNYIENPPTICCFFQEKGCCNAAVTLLKLNYENITKQDLPEHLIKPDHPNLSGDLAELIDAHLKINQLLINMCEATQVNNSTFFSRLLNILAKYPIPDFDCPEINSTSSKSETLQILKQYPLDLLDCVKTHLNDPIIAWGL